MSDLDNSGARAVLFALLAVFWPIYVVAILMTLLSECLRTKRHAGRSKSNRDAINLHKGFE